MSNRVTEKDLQNLVDMINESTGKPMKPYSGIGRANIGNYHLSFAYGGVTLHQIVSDGGGVTAPLGGGYFTKRELYYKLSAFLSGLGAR